MTNPSRERFELGLFEAVDLSQAAAELIARHGSVRAAARAVRMSYPYLHRIASGEKIHPGAAILKKLGLVQRCAYYRRKS